MSRKGRLFGLATLTLSAGVIGASQAFAGATPHSDDQVWSEIDLDAHVSDRLAFTATLVDRQGDGLPNPTLWGGGITGDYRWSPNWSLGGGAYEVQVRVPPSGVRLNAALPLAYVTRDWRIAGFHLSDRNRVEDIVYIPGNPWRYRNRLSLEHPLRLGLPVRSIYASDEIFYDFSEHRLSRNRAQVGLALAPLGPANIQLYLMRQDDEFARPSGLKVLGVTLRVELN